MPGIAANIQTGDYSGFETAASIFHGGAALGYIVIGLLAFLLGVCVTVLCFRLRQMNREDDQNKEREGFMELIENLLQLLTTFVGALLSDISYRKSGRQAYFLLLCFYGCFALGSLYWTLYLLLFDTTPRVFYVSEFGWVASVIFLRILQATLASQDERSFRCRRAWLAPAFSLPLLAFYCTFGDILSNLIWCGMMMWLSFCAIRGLSMRKRRRARRGICGTSTSACCALRLRSICSGRWAASGRTPPRTAPPSGVICC